MGEFELIERYFTAPAKALHTSAVVTGIGDDCAVLQLAASEQLVVSCDLLVEGRHFFAGTDPLRLGHKSLAVSLSDLAACGATPLGFTLALSLEQADATWLEAFSQGMLELARSSSCPLVGGDTTRGPLTINVTVFGRVPAGQALLRSGACIGDDIYVTGAIGEARAGLQVLNGSWQFGDAQLRHHLVQRLETPTPRLAVGERLRGVASSAMDISDGLRGDLGHILQASGVGARIDGTALLCTATRLWAAAELQGMTEERRISFAMAGGDDYELLLTARPDARGALAALGQELGVTITRIGEVVAGCGLEVRGGDGRPVRLSQESFDHFGAPA